MTRRWRFAQVVTIGILMLVTGALATAQSGSVARVFVFEGKDRKAATEPNPEKPTGPAYKPEIMIFFTRQDVKDGAGRAVSGIGLITWKVGVDVRVAVMKLVPKPGAPNEFLATPEKVHLLTFEPLTELTMKLDQEKDLSAETFGVPIKLAFRK